MFQAMTKSQPAAGALLAVGGSAILMGIITAEALYPAPYSTFDNEISDLGATRPPNSVILQPSASIFNLTMIVTGLLIVGGMLASDAVAGLLLLSTAVITGLALGASIAFGDIVVQTLRTLGQ